MSKHISNKIITFNDKDAPWITPQVKTSTKRSTRVYRKWVKLGRNPGNYKQHVGEVQNISSKLINEAKQIYYHNLGDKLSHPKIGQKSFWASFKRDVNTKKQTNIPPIIETDVYISDFLQKAEIFNAMFLIFRCLFLCSMAYPVIGVAW